SGSTSLLHDCTTLGGSSGSPVISLDQQAVVGLHFSGTPGSTNRAVQINTLKDVLTGKRSTVVVSALEAESVEASDRPHEADFFSHRRGYNRKFLGVDVPLPDIPGDLDLAKPTGSPGGRKTELRYQHFSVVYSNFAKCPAVAALNIDGGKIRPIKRKNKTWFFDLRIARENQLDQKDYGDPAIDRGHMIRRASTNWGTQEQAERANLDSYHYTVAAPQHKDLNRNAGTWLGLENHILESSKTHGFKANVFTGPVINDMTPDLEDTGGKLPLEFWKVVSMIAGDDDGNERLHATAYLLSQGRLIQSLLAQESFAEALEGFEFGEFKTFQIPIASLEKATGYDFGPLRDADPLNGALERESAPPVVSNPLDSVDDIIL
ncbi:MAG: DNA/RNA non-specific endonuclease, partial [Rhizobiaceae bacterium]